MAFRQIDARQQCLVSLISSENRDAMKVNNAFSHETRALMS